MDDNQMARMGARVAEYRRLNGVTAEELAASAGAGLTRAVIANLESGRKTEVSVQQWLALSAALGVPPMALLFDLTKPLHHVKLADSSLPMRTVDAVAWVSGTRSFQLPTRVPVRLPQERLEGSVAARRRWFAVRDYDNASRRLQSLREDIAKATAEGQADPVLHDQLVEAEERLATLSADLENSGISLDSNG